MGATNGTTMSRVYEALRQMEKEQGQSGTSLFPELPDVLDNSTPGSPEFNGVSPVKVQASPSARLVALSQARSLGAEAFRALATRLENLHRQKSLKSVQITSGLVNEGKTLVAANLAVTIASFGSKVLLVEGDLHRPCLEALLGLHDLRGLGDWWSGQASDITHSLHKLGDIPLWLLSAGNVCDGPSNILQSTRFAETFGRLAEWFDWIVVDSTPMLPIIDANLWSRLVDGTILVVRRGVTSVKALRKGLRSLDNLKLIGVVLNEALEFHLAGNNQYYRATNRQLKRQSKTTP
jgi:protein-tyrosine kinase